MLHLIHCCITLKVSCERDVPRAILKSTRAPAKLTDKPTNGKLKACV